MSETGNLKHSMFDTGELVKKYEWFKFVAAITFMLE